MTNIPTQRVPESDPIALTWQEAGLGPDSVVDLGDGISMTLQELLDEPSDDDER
jgi:hypothetical protein